MLYEKVIPAPQSSFSKRIFTCKHFPSKWHYHREFELILITRGHGKRFIGEGVEPFSEGDIVLIGDNVPHFHLSDAVYYEDNDLYCESDVIQFSRDIFPENVSNMQEFASIGNMLLTSAHGIHFTDPEVTARCREIFVGMRDMSALPMLIALYNMLDMLSRSTDFNLCSVYSRSDVYIANQANIHVIRSYEYLISHFKEQITLSEVAAHVGQNPSALCRNFKSNTGKSVFDCLAEIRIGFASRLLLSSSLPVTHIAFESGYRNISHFNHQFRGILGVSPSEYRHVGPPAVPEM